MMKTNYGAVEILMDGHGVPLKPSVLIISENAAEIKCSENKFVNLGYNVMVVKSIADILEIAHRFFDCIILSTSIQSFGLNFITLLFKKPHCSGYGKPMLFLMSGQNVIRNHASDMALYSQSSVDGMVMLKS